MTNSNKFLMKISICFLVFICIFTSTPIVNLYACAADKKMSCCHKVHKECCCHKKISQKNLKAADCNCVQEQKPFNKVIDQNLSLIKDFEYSEYLNLNKTNILCLFKQTFGEKVYSNKHLPHNKTIAMLNTVKLLI